MTPILRPAPLYRTAAVLLLLFAIGHTLGFRSTDSAWGVDGLIESMKTIRFEVQGFERTYWGFYVGFGLLVTVFLLFGALLSWQLASLDAATLMKLKAARWTLAGCFAIVAVLTWTFFFTAPGILSTLAAACLFLAALGPPAGG